MLSFFKKNKNKNTRGKSYYNRENLVHNLNDFISFFEPETIAQYTTLETIKFNGLSLSKINENSIKQTLEEPDFTFKEKEGLNGHKVLFYRHIVDNLIFLMQFHFLKGNFLFVSNTTSSSSLLSNTDKTAFVSRITNKYLPDTNIDLEKGLEIKISDSHSNFLNVVDGVNFKVIYVNHSQKNQQLLKNPNLANELMQDDFDAKLNDYF